MNRGENSVQTRERSFTIRRAERSDADGLLRLIAALAEFEKLTPPDAEAKTRLIEDGFGERPRFETWLAFVDDRPEPVGYAFFFETYSSFLARPTLYLEDIFVLHEHRGRGIGSALLNHCIGLAHARGCGRMEWTCLDWNTKAQCVYEKLGARRLSEWYLFRLTRDRMEQILAD
jgi:GNAT superfamily N-acetyltransferase